MLARYVDRLILRGCIDLTRGNLNSTSPLLASRVCLGKYEGAETLASYAAPAAAPERNSRSRRLSRYNWNFANSCPTRAPSFSPFRCLATVTCSLYHLRPAITAYEYRAGESALARAGQNGTPTLSFRSGETSTVAILRGHYFHYKVSVMKYIQAYN